MTVSELIEQLQTLPQDLQVWVSPKGAKVAYTPEIVKLTDTDEFTKPHVHIITSEK